MSSASTRENSFPLPDRYGGKGKEATRFTAWLPGTTNPRNACSDLQVLFVLHTKP
jgi:hypothetical protein